MQSLPLGVICYMCPSEVDSQITYLINQNLVDEVWVYDSDPIVLGAKRVFEVDSFVAGTGRYFSQARFKQFLAGKDFKDRPLFELLKKYGLHLLSAVAAISGCDFSKIPGCGIPTAAKALLNNDATLQ